MGRQARAPRLAPVFETDLYIESVRRQSSLEPLRPFDQGRAFVERLVEADLERLDRINDLLDEEIRPFLQNDGGDVYVVSLVGNKLTVHYQGACGSCPSSLSGTLTGIENLLKSIEPDIEVLAT